ncbi:hypothetical protein ACN4EK_20660 [Pantanalinema rosaneae CENA516]|uniref:hypothetical protein n=1 Tax=Pantanalinema rosaneae TaxID=1620701 RepID=UPI003D6F2E6C
MTQRRVRSSRPDVKANYQPTPTRHGTAKPTQTYRSKAHLSDRQPQSRLLTLIAQDAPLQTHSTLLLMYGPFQAEMLPEHKQGVASWLRDCVRKHGLPSLVRFDYRHRAQIFRRDQFQSWLEPLVSQAAS